MPNPASAGLPNAAMYNTDQAGVVRDELTALAWEQAVTDGLTPDAAEAHCEALELGGFDDWRLPSRIELMTLLDYTVSDLQVPHIDQQAFPNTPAQWFMSITDTCCTASAFVWQVHFGFGRMNEDFSAVGSRFKCVRGEAFASSFEAGSGAFEGTVLEQTTGLRWEQPHTAEPLSHADATARCTGLALAGFSDWRLPSVNELALIVDDTRKQPAIDVTSFPMDETAYGTTDVSPVGFWTSSLDTVSEGERGVILFGTGQSHARDPADLAFSRCVR